MPTMIRLLAAMVPAFFLAGAVVFPLIESFTLARILVTGGMAALLYGLESVVRFGHVEICGLLSDNCTQYSVRLIGCLMWAALFVLREFVAARRRRASTSSLDRPVLVSTVEFALALATVVIALTWLANGLLGNKSSMQGEVGGSPTMPWVARMQFHDAAARHGLTFGLLQPKVPALGAMRPDRSRARC